MARPRVLAAAAFALLAVAAAFLFAAAGPASAELTAVPRRALLQGSSGSNALQALGGGGNNGNSNKAASPPSPAAADKSSSPSPSPSPPADKSSPSPSPPPASGEDKSKEASNAQQSKDSSKRQENANSGNKGNNANSANSNNQSKADKKAPAPAPEDKKAPAPAPAAPAPAAPAPAAPAPALAAPAPASAAPAPAPAKAPTPAPAPSPAESKDSKDTKEKTPDGKPVPVAPPGKPAGLPPKEVPVGPSGVQPDNGSKDSVVPTDKEAKDNSRGAKAAPVDKFFPGVEVKSDAKEKQEDPSGKGLIVGTVINPESAISASRSSGGQGVEVKQGPSQNFASLFNEAPESSGNVKPELRGVPQWGGGGGGSLTGNNYYPINWLNANVYAIPRYTPSGILGWFTGVGSTQSVIIVLDNWQAKVVGWGPTPIYRAPAVGFTFSWGFYEYLWYANTYGSWGWKSPPLSLVMYDNWGNRLQVEVYVTLNLKTWEVWNTKITEIQFLGGGGWGSGRK